MAVINNTKSNTLLSGTNGNDTIQNGGRYDGGSYVTINAGAGNDYVFNGGDGDRVTINTDTGNDDVYNYGSYVMINTSAGNDYVYNHLASNVTINTGAGDDSIKVAMSSLVTIDAGVGNDSIFNNCYLIYDGSIQYYRDDYGKNMLFKYSSGDGNDKIYGFKANSTLSIGGGSYSTKKSGDDIIVTVDDGSILLKNAASLSSINIDGDAIPTNPTLLTVTNSTKSPVTVDSVVKTIDASTRRRPIRITGNALDNSITGGKGKDTIYGGAGNDTLTDTNGKNIFIYDSGNDIITDFNEKKDSISLSADYQSYALKGDDLIFNFGNNNSLTIKDGAGKKVSSIKNKKKSAEFYTSDGILGDKNKSMTLSSTVTAFDATSAKDYSKVVTIDGSAAEGEISITGNRKKNYITAGANDSTLSGGKGNDTLVGGDGQDVFIYSNGDGKDIVENYDAGDRINLNGATIKDAMIKNNSGVIKIGSGSLTVKDTSEFILADGNSETIVSDGVFIADGIAKVYGSFKGTIDLDEHDLTTADASLAKKATTINGGADNDSIVGGKGSDKIYGNEGADILIGGKGNDSLWGGDDNDTFIYNVGTGNDFIMDYAEGDMLRILDKQGNEGSFSKATFGNESLTLNITGGGKVTFKNVSETTAFNINGESYHVEGKTLAQ